MEKGQETCRVEKPVMVFHAQKTSIRCITGKDTFPVPHPAYGASAYG